MSFPARKKIGRYEICSQLGVGGMGEVYLANDTKLDRKVALKILPPELGQDTGDRVRRFIQEAKSASALKRQLLTQKPTDDLRAYDFYVRGRELLYLKGCVKTRFSEVIE